MQNPQIPPIASVRDQRCSLSSVTKSERALKKHQGVLIVYLLALPILFAFSYLFIPSSAGISEELPGGKALEISFWMTALASSFFAFYSMENLFRSPDSKILAPLPLRELAIFSQKLRRMLRILALTLAPIIAFWLSLGFEDPLRAIINISLWIFGLLSTILISMAIVLYSASQKRSNSMTSFGPAAYVAGPAIAFAVSLLSILLLKLLGEALLKPNYFDAALVASSLVFAITLASYLYARRLCRLHYYALMAEFFENDLILLNKNFDYLDDKNIQNFYHSLSRAIWHKDSLQYKRKYTLNYILIVTLSILILLWLLSSAANLSFFNPSILATIPVLFLAHVWLKLNSSSLESGILKTLPISRIQLSFFKYLSSVFISIKMSLPTILSVVIALIYHESFVRILIFVSLSLAINFLAISFLSIVSVYKSSLAQIVTLGLALGFVLFGFVAQQIIASLIIITLLTIPHIYAFFLLKKTKRI